MKKLLYIIALASALIAVPVIQTGCGSNPSSRVNQVKTLKILGQTAKTGMDGATDLLKKGRITVKQWQDVADFYDFKWQPAYALAVSANRSDLSSIGSPELIALAGQLAILVEQLTTKPAQ